MEGSITLFFSDGSTMSLSKGQKVVGFIAGNGKESFKSGGIITIEEDVEGRLIPSILDVLGCDFFYVDSNQGCIYCSSAIVKIEEH